MISRTIVNRPISTFIAFVVLMVTGLFTFGGLAVDLLPDFSVPVVVIRTSYGEASPEEVEQLITRTVETGMTSLPRLEKISSRSSKGSSTVILEFSFGTDLDSAVNNIRDALDRVKAALPDEADTPSIFQYDPNQSPILDLIVSGDNRSPEEIRSLAENFIQPQIERLDGVSLTNLSGSRERIIKVTVSQNRLDAYGLTLTEISRILSTQNSQISGGSLLEGDIEFLVRTAGEYSSLEEIKNTVIAYKGSSGTKVDPLSYNSLVHTIRLRDVANVEDTYNKQKEVVYFNGLPALRLAVHKQTGENSVQVADRVLNSIDRINKTLPVGLSIKPVRDTSVFIRNSIEEVTSSGLMGGLLAVSILFIFLRNVRSTFIISLAIPIAFIITLMGMSFLGLSLNIMTLTGLSLGIGMLVDNAVVILENIYRYREKGVKLKPSAILGTEEMLSPMFSSTMTTVCVFLPLLFFKKDLGVQGQILGGMAFTVVVSVLASLLVAAFLVPVLSSHFLPIYTRRQKPLTGLIRKIDLTFAKFFDRLDSSYRRSIAWAVNHKKRVIGFIGIIFFSSLFLTKFLGLIMMPSTGDDQVSLSVRLPKGSSLSSTHTVLLQMEEIIKKEIKGYNNIILTAKSGSGDLSITLPSAEERIDTFESIQEKLRKHFNDFPAGISFSFGGGRISGAAGSPIDIVINSNNLDLLSSTSEKIEKILENDFKDQLTNISTDLTGSLPQIDIVIDRERAYALGLNIATIGQEIRASLDGIKTTTQYRSAGKDINIVVSLSERDKKQSSDLGRIFVTNNKGERISLDNVARTVITTGPTQINRENQSRTIHVTASLLPGVDLSSITQKVQKSLLEKVVSSEDLSVSLSGEYGETIKQLGVFGKILIVAIILIFGIMAAQFESFMDPFIILFTIPLSVTGVIGVYLLTGNSFSVFSAIGVVMLAGIAVNNGIILVEYIRLLRFRGYQIVEAIVEASRSRLRPILITNLTTILGLLPLAFTKGDSGSLVQPIGLTILGGLTTSAILTLFFIPCLYHIFHFSIPLRLKRLKKFFSKSKQIS